MDISGYDDDEVEKLLHEQATRLFKLCDCGNKNYITREDLLTLSNELELHEDLINEAYDRLDINNNGFLTLREFVTGFGLFLGLEREERIDSTILDEEYVNARNLFDLCDTDKKEYVTKLDLSRLNDKLGLTSQQIENIFTNLDKDGNGFITFDEFLQGFSSSVINSNTIFHQDSGISNNDDEEEEEDNGFDEKYFIDSHSKSSKNILEKSESVSSNRSERMFVTRQMSIRYESGVNGIDDMLDKVEDEIRGAIPKDQLQELWDSVSSTGDHTTTKIFEDFVKKVYNEIKTARQEAKHLENVLESKTITHNAEIKQICEDMEAQMMNEKAKQKEMESQKEIYLREDLRQELQEKEKHLEKFMQRQSALESRLKEVVEEEQRLKAQNSNLLKENVLLEDKLNSSMSNLEYLKSNLHHLEEQTKQEKKETLKAAFQATQGIQYEHENLIKQLDMLRSVNQKLRDDRDTIEASLKSKVVRLPSLKDEMVKEKQKLSRTGSNLDHYFPLRTSTSTPTHSPLKKQGSILSNYFAPIGDHVHSPIQDMDSPNFNAHREGTLNAIGENEEDVQSHDQEYFNRTSTNYETEDIEVFEQASPSKILETTTNSAHTTIATDRSELLTSEVSDVLTPSSPRRPPIGMNREDSIASSAPSLDLLNDTPSRVYKIVFVGDSGVGKSSFIHRFCFDDFRINFTATIGVDFQVKTIKLNRQVVALQLWDTAGQERFRSITKQYFRRADGVVVMFDLSSWSSYTNVKGWMLNIEEGAEPDCVVMLLGNKKDLVEKDESLRKVKSNTAEKLAADYNASYAEVSACSGVGVLEAMQKMAKKMEQSEDTLLKHSVLNLNFDREEKKKKKCC
ncbi:EF-hand calcium-binding domain-containing protein 4B-like isoform X2 [Hydractinia symbiolongicarpus]|nr:EF-hand calcium-binding domain-containing protein 4B-like isoform X2 [Hydractinia symbiolongicarpus]XP_057309966.1 EF-hand calcium-binding domain-containing protein 4B-like isoform X2 [Hydractinia symbiolongicarpus]